MRIISGEAGSGKTFVAAKLLLDDLMAGNKVLLCTEDPILFEHMYNIIESNDIDPIALEWKQVSSSNAGEHLVSIVDMINNGKYDSFSRIHFDGIYLEKKDDLLNILDGLKDPEKVSVALQTMHSGCKSVRVISHSKGSGKLEKVIPAEDMRAEFNKLECHLKKKYKIT
ncbi:hypothetical protein CampHawk_180 [Bacillus phage CampHawk]|uniref:Uncharacterized protein n=2 Tax=Okubovirus camphawk TaxID=1986015 RepID=U5PX89_9CAUD|nr:hypothetical protein CampHawk_180 [Bacillus phage CampHawk]AGY47058.1 hypothetical protein CampHawk_180 [Bacillus phage CampHawk]APZ82417.1 hypothetical protein Goe2_c18100 [Bacillus phage vB_BsuM-Goe2]